MGLPIATSWHTNGPRFFEPYLGIQMKIYYEDSMPYAAEFFAELGECQVFSSKKIEAQQLADADVLLVRSTTKVTAELLANSPHLQFVGTATAGTDHVDQEYLQSRDIEFKSAGGCNAVAVAEYVLSTLFVMCDRFQWQLQDKTVGIVGAGFVGSALAQKLDILGIDYKLCDPPLENAGDHRDFVDIDEIMQCDFITLHVPLVTSGPYPTDKLFDRTRLSQLSNQQVLINACRGEVLDNAAALSLLKQGKSIHLVLDVWENEPEINFELIPFVALGTAHIAGHTIEGKARGTEMLYQALCKRFKLTVSKKLSDYLPEVEGQLTTVANLDFWQNIQNLVLQVYDIGSDSKQFKDKVASAEQFRYIRKHYPIRREFSAIAVNAGNFPQSKAIYALGFLQG